MRALALAPFLALAACAADAGGGAPSARPATGSATLRLGEEARLGGASVRALRVVEDSRCPRGVQCIHAGTVRVAVRVSEGGAPRELVLRAFEPQPLAAGRQLRLTAVCPDPQPPGAQVADSDYLFHLDVAEAGAPPPMNPVCPPR